MSETKAVKKPVTMNKAEELARQKKCIAMKLTTLGSQAPDFYKRHGFARMVGHVPMILREEDDLY